jgi:hypothetical protein
MSTGPAEDDAMTDELDPTMSSRTAMGGGESAGMDPEGLMPADPSLHDPAETTTTSTDELTTPHDQPAEGGRDEDELPGADTGTPDVAGGIH